MMKGGKKRAHPRPVSDRAQTSEAFASGKGGTECARSDTVYLKTKSGVTIASGRLPRDAEYKLAGAKNIPLCKFGIAALETRDETGERHTTWCNCTAWRDLAQAASTLRKGDTVLITGTTTAKTYTAGNGEQRQHEECTVDFVLVMPRHAGAGSLDDLSRFPNVRDMNGIDAAFDELDGEDGELPF